MLDSIALIGLLAGLTALWIWNWKMLQVVEQHERAILELRARLIKKEIEEYVGKK